MKIKNLILLLFVVLFCTFFYTHCTTNGKLRYAQYKIDFDKNKGDYYYMMDFIKNNKYNVLLISIEPNTILYFEHLDSSINLDTSIVLQQYFKEVVDKMKKLNISDCGYNSANKENVFDFSFNCSFVNCYSLIYFKEKEWIVDENFKCINIDSNWKIVNTRFFSI